MKLVPVRHPKCGVVCVFEEDIPKFAVSLERLPVEHYVIDGESIEIWPHLGSQSILFRGERLIVDTANFRKQFQGAQA
jgi:hypothetical protein